MDDSRCSISSPPFSVSHPLSTFISMISMGLCVIWLSTPTLLPSSHELRSTFSFCFRFVIIILFHLPSLSLHHLASSLYAPSASLRPVAPSVTISILSPLSSLSLSSLLLSRLLAPPPAFLTCRLPRSPCFPNSSPLKIILQVGVRENTQKKCRRYYIVPIVTASPLFLYAKGFAIQAPSIQNRYLSTPLSSSPCRPRPGPRVIKIRASRRGARARFPWFLPICLVPSTIPRSVSPLVVHSALVLSGIWQRVPIPISRT
ncbi:hypothetical protein BD309DRAFT_379793 [Dichomitus squalens]|nr:hypothetical protein BD309DRAFT_379793 [Dichomitus squalens]